jgi:hypothetical protein
MKPASFEFISERWIDDVGLLQRSRAGICPYQKFPQLWHPQGGLPKGLRVPRPRLLRRSYEECFYDLLASANRSARWKQSNLGF